MRTLFEIVEAAKDGDKPTHDECYYAMLVLIGQANLAHAALHDHAPARIAEVRETGYRSALDADPRTYLGTGVPENPHYRAWRREGKAFIERALGNPGEGGP